MSKKIQYELFFNSDSRTSYIDTFIRESLERFIQYEEGAVEQANLRSELVLEAFSRLIQILANKGFLYATDIELIAKRKTHSSCLVEEE